MKQKSGVLKSCQAGTALQYPADGDVDHRLGNTEVLVGDPEQAELEHKLGGTLQLGFTQANPGGDRPTALEAGHGHRNERTLEAEVFGDLCSVGLVGAAGTLADQLASLQGHGEVLGLAYLVHGDDHLLDLEITVSLCAAAAGLVPVTTSPISSIVIRVLF